MFQASFITHPIKSISNAIISHSSIFFSENNSLFQWRFNSDSSASTNSPSNSLPLKTSIYAESFFLFKNYLCVLNKNVIRIYKETENGLLLKDTIIIKGIPRKIVIRKNVLIFVHSDCVEMYHGVNMNLRESVCLKGSVCLNEGSVCLKKGSVCGGKRESAHSKERETNFGQDNLSIPLSIPLSMPPSMPLSMPLSATSRIDSPIEIKDITFGDLDCYVLAGNNKVYKMKNLVETRMMSFRRVVLDLSSPGVNNNKMACNDGMACNSNGVDRMTRNNGMTRNGNNEITCKITKTREGINVLRNGKIFKYEEFNGVMILKYSIECHDATSKNDTSRDSNDTSGYDNGTNKDSDTNRNNNDPLSITENKTTMVGSIACNDKIMELKEAPFLICKEKLISIFIDGGSFTFNDVINDVNINNINIVSIDSFEFNEFKGLTNSRVYFFKEVKEEKFLRNEELGYEGVLGFKLPEINRKEIEVPHYLSMGSLEGNLEGGLEGIGGSLEGIGGREKEDDQSVNTSSMNHSTGNMNQSTGSMNQSTSNMNHSVNHSVTLKKFINFEEKIRLCKEINKETERKRKEIKRKEEEMKEIEGKIKNEEKNLKIKIYEIQGRIERIKEKAKRIIKEGDLKEFKEKIEILKRIVTETRTRDWKEFKKILKVQRTILGLKLEE